jgi:hypothetical protein
MDPFEALDYIANALKTSIEYCNPNDDSYETRWKPRIDCIRAAIMTPELKQAMYDVMFDIMDHTPWDPPFDQLQSE